MPKHGGMCESHHIRDREREHVVTEGEVHSERGPEITRRERGRGSTI